jgi:hypothetical protein
MTATQPGRTGSETEVRGRARDSYRHRELRETKPSFMTTEFWAMLAGIVALVVIYNVSDEPSLTLFRACLLGTILAAGYFVSRGLAKAGSHDDYWDEDPGRDRYR